MNTEQIPKQHMVLPWLQVLQMYFCHYHDKILTAVNIDTLCRGQKVKETLAAVAKCACMPVHTEHTKTEQGKLKLFH